MVDIGRKLFAKIHKQKHHANHNHDVHFMALDLTPARYAIGLLHQFTTKADTHDQAPVLSTPDLYATA